MNFIDVAFVLVEVILALFLASLVWRLYSAGDTMFKD